MFGESPLIGEVAEARFGKPRGHEAGFGYLCDLGGVFFHLFKRRQAEWSGADGMMAGEALGGNNGGDVLVISDGFWRLVRRLGAVVAEQVSRQNQKEKQSPHRANNTLE